MVTNNHINYSNEKMVVLSLRNISSLSFHDPPITPFKTFLQSKLCPEMTVRCLSSSLEPRKKKISNTGKQCNHVLIPRNYILSDSKKSLPSVERPKMC